MTKPDRDPSIDREPQRRDQPAKPDRSEKIADKILRRSVQPGSEEDLAAHSVFDEPDVFPGREAEVIDRDWHCSHCGYNLRGLPTGHRCPECGKITLYRPPPPGGVSYGTWYRRQKSIERPYWRWGFPMLAGVVAALSAIPAALLMSVPSPITALIIAPAAEEAIKIFAILLLLDARPFYIRSSTEIWTAAALAAVLFAVVHTACTLAWFITAPSLGLILWRWIGWPVAHIVCTAVATTGLVAVWREADREARRPDTAKVVRPFVLAIALHAGLNALLVFWLAPSYGF